MPIDMGLTIAPMIMHNCMVKTYPDGSREITAAPRALFREPGWEQSDDYAAAEDRRRAAIRKQRGEDFDLMFGGGYADAEDGGDTPPTRDADSIERSKRRARTMVRDYARSNDFAYFVTLTLDASKVDRYDPAQIMRVVNRWLDNRVRRKGLQYILVPELHKDGAVHFHGFFNSALPAVDSGTLSNGGKPRKPRSKRQRERMLAEGWHVVYNLPDWSLGYTTAIELYGERDKAISYVCKYVAKEQTKVGGRWYYSGGALALPDKSYTDVDYDELKESHGNSEFTIDNLGITMIRYFVRGIKMKNPLEEIAELWSIQTDREGWAYFVELATMIAMDRRAGVTAPIAGRALKMLAKAKGMYFLNLDSRIKAAIKPLIEADEHALHCCGLVPQKRTACGMADAAAALLCAWWLAQQHELERSRAGSDFTNLGK